MDGEMNGEQEVECVQDETCQAAPAEPVVEPTARQERQSFNNQPLKGLENLKLF